MAFFETGQRRRKFRKCQSDRVLLLAALLFGIDTTNVESYQQTRYSPSFLGCKSLSTRTIFRPKLDFAAHTSANNVAKSAAPRSRLFLQTINLALANRGSDAGAGTIMAVDGVVNASTTNYLSEITNVKNDAGSENNFWERHFDDPETNEWRDAWKTSVPQRSIYEQGLPRDRWKLVAIPANLSELQEALNSPAVRRILSEPQERNYWLYVTGRTVFFFLSSFTNALMQINTKADWRPWVAGRNLRMEVAAALKRVAMSGERKEAQVQDSATRIPDTGARVRKLFGSIAELYRRDCQNIVCGIYRAPYDASLRHRQFNPFFVRECFLHTLEASIETGVRRARGRRGFTEVRAAVYRRFASAASGVIPVDDPFEDAVDLYNDNYLLGNVSQYPNYYLQNFHWQTDGWLSSKSARAYEYSTETLFSGSQDAMQRQGLVSISEYLALHQGVKAAADMRLLEVACGTGRFHTFIKDNWPDMRTVASDLSPFYLQAARDNFDQFQEFTARVTGRRIAPPEFVQCAAEALPFKEAVFDMVTCTYLFHEIPLPVRRLVAREMFRVLIPGGVAVITDSYQMGDRPEIDHVGAVFPANYHEPFYRSYFRDTDLVAIFQAAGFTFRRHQCAHLSKVLTFDKPDPTTTPPPDAAAAAVGASQQPYTRPPTPGGPGERQRVMGSKWAVV